jgi:NAD(P)H-dependent FMN reductase
MIQIGIIVGSTRVGRLGTQVADWVFKLSNQRPGVTYEVVEIADYQLGMFGEAAPTEGVKRWQDKIKSLDGFIFVTAEYNHTITASLKNALDYTLENWFNKAAGIVSYGYAGGTRAAEHLRSILGALQVADVRQHVTVSLVSEVTKEGVLNPGSYQVSLVNTLFDQVEAWSKALKTIR